MAGGNAAVWKAASAVILTELLVTPFYPTLLWVTSGLLIYVLFFWHSYNPQQSSITRLLTATLLKSVLSTNPLPCALTNLVLLFAVTRLQPEDDPYHPGLPVHTKSLGMSFSALAVRCESLTLLVLLIAANPVTRPDVSLGVSLVDASLGVQLFLFASKRGIRHAHWKLAAVNAVILVRSLACAASEEISSLWLAVVVVVGVCGQVADEAGSHRGSLLSFVLSLFACSHMLVFPGASAVLSVTLASAMVLTGMLLCFAMSPPLWLIFSNYTWLKQLHRAFLLHFLLPLCAVCEGDGLFLAPRTL